MGGQEGARGTLKPVNFIKTNDGCHREENVQESQQALPEISSEHAAFFFDLDGTLASLQPEPDLVSVPGHVRDDLCLLHRNTSGALAIISGRPLAQIDTLLAPLCLPAAGIHGAERRETDGRLTGTPVSTHILTAIEHALTEGIIPLPGVVLEKKRVAFALHYRQAPRHGEAVRALAQQVAAHFPALEVQQGKCVIELKPESVNKGVAIKKFMESPPFAGRVPVFLGDDLTDEQGFILVNQLKGISVKIGEGPTHAHYRLLNNDAVYAWIKQLLSPGAGNPHS